ncbi:hypothetical protein HYDPIDRAFT_33512 [Hydnomerulius pinastri MD-312]|uniref:Uncharacterized protein n=1 Tax=Hydnomerulius pinastri MD-312 TaxID=994086 RepID=A0A0C9W827_9AGAM|nr:hypothetical protein HYDPIDRAFT_33512 [Hydnomerulius pinastri MD-312]
MPTSVKIISPFYNDDSAAPPPFPPMLTDQLELFGSGHHSSTLLADKTISSNNKPLAKVQPTSEQPQKNTLALVFRLARHSPKPGAHASSPYPKKTFKYSSHSQASSELSSSESSESSDFFSDDESTLSTLSEDSKIPKPSGEPGRPGRGGYNLETALDWNHKAYTKFKKYTHRLIEDHLDVTKCASAQSPALIKVVRDKVMDAFPDLENYSNGWPVTDMIMMYLKYTSSRTRRQELEMAAGKGKKVKASTDFVATIVVYSSRILSNVTQRSVFLIT